MRLLRFNADIRNNYGSFLFGIRGREHHLNAEHIPVVEEIDRTAVFRRRILDYLGPESVQSLKPFFIVINRPL